MPSAGFSTSPVLRVSRYRHLWQAARRGHHLAHHLRASRPSFTTTTWSSRHFASKSRPRSPSRSARSAMSRAPPAPSSSSTPSSLSACDYYADQVEQQRAAILDLLHDLVPRHGHHRRRQRRAERPHRVRLRRLRHRGHSRPHRRRRTPARVVRLPGLAPPPRPPPSPSGPLAALSPASATRWRASRVVIASDARALSTAMKHRELLVSIRVPTHFDPHLCVS